MWPFVVHTEGFELPSYIVINSLAFSIGVIWVYFRAKKKNLDTNAILDVAVAAMLGCFIGARVAHILIEHPGFYLAHPSFIFRFWNGGFVFYGGFIGGFLFALLPMRRRKLSFLKMAD